MKKEDLLSDEFLKQLKTGEDPNGFLAQLQKRGIEVILSGILIWDMRNMKKQLHPILVMVFPIKR
jgi:hypothetical protein